MDDESIFVAALKVSRDGADFKLHVLRRQLQFPGPAETTETQMVFVEGDRFVRVNRADVIVSHHEGSQGWNEFGAGTVVGRFGGYNAGRNREASMIQIRDAVYLTVFAVGGYLWYADRALLAKQLGLVRAALENEKRHNERIGAKLIDAERNRRD